MDQHQDFDAQMRQVCCQAVNTKLLGVLVVLGDLTVFRRLRNAAYCRDSLEDGERNPSMFLMTAPELTMEPMRIKKALNIETVETLLESIGC